MRMELKRELTKFERELSVLVARFLRIYDEFVGEEAPPLQPKDEEPVGLAPGGFATDFLNAYT